MTARVRVSRWQSNLGLVLPLLAVLHVGAGVLAGRRGARRLAGQRGALLQEQARPRVQTEPADEAQDVVDWVHRILEQERDIVIASKPLEVTRIEVDGIKWPYVFHELGLAIKVLYS